jgi:hypothetical protein
MTTREKIQALKEFICVLPQEVESYKDNQGALFGCLTHLAVQQFFAADDEEQQFQLDLWERKFSESGHIRDSWKKAQRKKFISKSFYFEKENSLTFEKKWGMSLEAFAIQPDSVKVKNKLRYDDYRSLT